MSAEGTIVGDWHILCTIVAHLSEASLSAMAQHVVVTLSSIKVSHSITVGHLAVWVLVT